MAKKQTIRVMQGGVAVAALLSAGSVAVAQTQPDAGAVLRENRESSVSPSRTVPQIQAPPEVRPAVGDTKIKVKVDRFTVSGNTVFTAEQLLELLVPAQGRELDFNELNKAAALISQHYRENGYFIARAYLPAQKLSGGVVDIAVIEGRLGKVTVQRSGETRLSDPLVEKIVTTAVTPGEPIRDLKLERGLMLLSDIPGMEVKSTIVPGATPGTADLMVEAKEGALVTGSVDADNFGNRFTGAGRIGASFNVNDPSGRGDQVSARFMTSGAGMRYGRLGYSLPVGDYGTKMGVAYSHMNYSLQKDFANLNANGNAGVASIYAVHPFERSRYSNVYGSIGFDRKSMVDNQSGANSQNKRINVVNLGLSGDRTDSLGRGGLTSWGVVGHVGDLDLGRNATAKNNDATTAQTNGSYQKLSYNVARLQSVADQVTFYGAFSGQLAGKNLDSSEKFSLGGLGVRAYPMGEASGDNGYLMNMEARYAVPGVDQGNLQLVGFVDHGGVTLHETTWNGWTTTGQRNNYSLSGVGVGLNFQKVGAFTLRSSYAWKVGNNPGRDTNGKDSDGTNNSGRFWLQASAPF